MEITFDRLKHSLAVANKMKQMSMQENIGCNPDDAFILGMLHDIGYEFSDKQIEHAHNGGLVLKAQGYKYWKEVYYHGIPQKEYDSFMLRLLNYADMTTGPSGEPMTMENRIDDICKRYGRGSAQEKEAAELKIMLNDKGFF